MIASGLLSANTDPATKTGNVPATLVRVESRETPSHSNYAGGSPSHLALQSEIHPHDIGMGVGSTTDRTHWRLLLGLSDGALCSQPRDPGQSHQARHSCDPFPRPSDANGDRESERGLGTLCLRPGPGLPGCGTPKPRKIL